jgi:DNA-directed RNA polymerase sigma subunit (sigma70/sigma32)
VKELAKCLGVEETRIPHLLDRLTFRSREILRARYSIGRDRATLEETAEEFRTDRIVLRKEETAALRRLRELARSESC